MTCGRERERGNSTHVKKVAGDSTLVCSDASESLAFGRGRASCAAYACAARISATARICDDVRPGSFSDTCFLSATCFVSVIWPKFWTPPRACLRDNMLHHCRGCSLGGRDRTRGGLLRTGGSAINQSFMPTASKTRSSRLDYVQRAEEYHVL